MSLDDDLRHRLAERAASVEPAPDWDDLQARIGRARRRRRLQGVAGACALVLLAGVVAMAVWPHDPDRPDVRAEDRDDETEPPVVGDVVDALSAPLDVRTNEAMVWTGREVVVWGGEHHDPIDGSVVYNDGAAYDPDTEHWRPMSESPLAGAFVEDGQGVARAAWTGSEVLIVQAGQAAAWDPESDSWREVAPPPDPDIGGVANTFDGTLGLLAADGAVIEVRPRSSAVWDPVDDEWAQLPDPPVEIWQGTTAGPAPSSSSWAQPRPPGTRSSPKRPTAPPTTRPPSSGARSPARIWSGPPQPPGPAPRCS